MMINSDTLVGIRHPTGNTGTNSIEFQEKTRIKLDCFGCCCGLIRVALKIPRLTARFPVHGYLLKQEPFKMLSAIVQNQRQPRPFGNLALTRKVAGLWPIGLQRRWSQVKLRSLDVRLWVLRKLRTGLRTAAQLCKGWPRTTW